VAQDSYRAAAEIVSFGRGFFRSVILFLCAVALVTLSGCVTTGSLGKPSPDARKFTLWPFVRTVRDEPRDYQETHVLWPFFKKASLGQERIVRVWPFYYTHDAPEGGYHLTLSDVNSSWALYSRNSSNRFRLHGRIFPLLIGSLNMKTDSKDVPEIRFCWLAPFLPIPIIGYYQAEYKGWSFLFIHRNLLGSARGWMILPILIWDDIEGRNAREGSASRRRMIVPLFMGSDMRLLMPRMKAGDPREFYRRRNSRTLLLYMTRHEQKETESGQTRLLRHRRQFVPLFNIPIFGFNRDYEKDRHRNYYFSWLFWSQRDGNVRKWRLGPFTIRTQHTESQASGEPEAPVSVPSALSESE